MESSEPSLPIAEEEIVYVYASFWERAGAIIIDQLILGALSILLVINAVLWKSLTPTLVISVIVMLYKPLMEGLFAATLGKMAMEIRLVNSADQKITIIQGFVRNFVGIIWSLTYIAVIVIFALHHNNPMAVTYFTSGGLFLKLVRVVTVAFGVADLIYFAKSSEFQTLRDWIAGTYAVKKQIEIRIIPGGTQV